MDKEFNRKCAEFMDITVDDYINELTTRFGICVEYNPHDDLNQLADVFDKALTESIDKHEQTLSLSNAGEDGIKQALRDFVTQCLSD